MATPITAPAAAGLVWPQPQDGPREALLALSRLALAFAVVLAFFRKWSGSLALIVVASLGAAAGLGYAESCRLIERFSPSLYVVGDNAADYARPAFDDLRRDAKPSPLDDWSGPGTPGAPVADPSCRVGGWLPLDYGDGPGAGGARGAVQSQLAAYNEAVAGHRAALMQPYMRSPEYAMLGANRYGSAYGPPGQTTRGGGGTTRFYRN